MGSVVKWDMRKIAHNYRVTMVVRDFVLITFFLKFHNVSKLLCHFYLLHLAKKSPADTGTPKLKSTEPSL